MTLEYGDASLDLAPGIKEGSTHSCDPVALVGFVHVFNFHIPDFFSCTFLKRAGGKAGDTAKHFLAIAPQYFGGGESQKCSGCGINSQDLPLGADEHGSDVQVIQDLEPLVVDDHV